MAPNDSPHHKKFDDEVYKRVQSYGRSTGTYMSPYDMEETINWERGLYGGRSSRINNSFSTKTPIDTSGDLNPKDDI